MSNTPYSDKIDKLTNEEIFNGHDYPMKAGFLIAEARHLRRTLETIVNRITDLPNYADDPVLEGLVYVASEAIENTDYMAYKPPAVEPEEYPAEESVEEMFRDENSAMDTQERSYAARDRL